MNTKLCLATLIFCLYADAQQFPLISRTVVNPQRTGPSRRFIKYQNGYFFNTEYETLGEGRFNLYVYEQAGSLKYRSAIWFPDAVRVVVNDAGAKADGSLVATGTALKNDGSLARFIAFMGVKDELDHVVRINPFIPFHMTIASDDTIWIFGRQFPDSSGAVEFDVLERYSPAGVKTGSFLPRSSFEAKSDPGIDSESIVCSGKDRIGVYSAPTKEWIELDLNGRVLGRWSAPLPTGVQNRGKAIGSDGSVYAVFGNGKQTQLFRLNKESTRWESIPAATNLEGSLETYYIYTESMVKA